MRKKSRLLKLISVTALAALALIFGATTDSQEDSPRRVPHSEAYAPTPIPDRVNLTLTQDPARSQAVTWRTDATVKKATAQLAVAEEGPRFTGKARDFEAITTSFTSDLGEANYHSVMFKGLSPESIYVYRVGDGRNWSPWNQFKTASADAKPFTFIYFGDAQNNVRSMWSRVIRQSFKHASHASFLLHAGDLINRPNSDGEWGEWFEAGGWINQSTPLLATPGNHEYWREGLQRNVSKNWRPQFTLPENGPEGLEETVYYLDYQGVRIISLNSNESPRKQVDWLRTVLSNNPCKWTVMTFHHPMYSPAKGRDNPHLRRLWQPIFDEYKVDLVLNGHDHTYGRTGHMLSTKNIPEGSTIQDLKNGTVYVTSVSGPKMYKVDEQPWMKKWAENTQLYQVISINGLVLSYKAYTARGDLFDAFDLSKETGIVELDVPPLPEISSLN